MKLRLSYKTDAFSDFEAGSAKKFSQELCGAFTRLNLKTGKSRFALEVQTATGQWVEVLDPDRPNKPVRITGPTVPDTKAQWALCKQAHQEKDFERFIRAVQGRLDKGRAQYGNRSFDRTPGELVDEIGEELLDLCGWSYVLWTRLQRVQGVVESVGGGE